jgi:hypothetical protein
VNQRTDVGDGADNPRWNKGRASFFEVREETIDGSSPLDVNPGGSGGIRIRGWGRGDVLVRTRIIAFAKTKADASRLASSVRVETAGGRIRATGPPPSSDERWCVNFELQVPRVATLTLNTENGGISIDDFRGIALFQARNGGVSLVNVGGDLRGETTNGEVAVDLTGDRWDGPGLDVATRNGGVRLTMPKGYSAELETGTDNGRLSIDFPAIARSTRDRRHFSAILGSGGSTIRAVTTNGGVTIRERQLTVP